MVRARDGLLQVLPRRRKLDRQADTAGGAPIDRTLRVGGPALEHALRKREGHGRKRRPQM